MTVPVFFQRHWRLLVGIVILIAIAGVFAAVLGGSRLTPYIEGPKFRAMLDQETSKGLHFHGQYPAIKRTGFLTVATGGFQATDGVKAMKSLTAHDVTARFDPAGVLLRRWTLDYVHIRSGVVEIQTYIPKPEIKPPKPWYAIFLPDRVYLCAVTCDSADVIWPLHGVASGIYSTRLLVTPHGRDFDYYANGGELRSGEFAPVLGVKAIHLLITKEILKVYQFELLSRDATPGSIRLTGEAGMKDDKHVQADLDCSDLAIAPWLPASLRKSVAGRLSGQVHWRSTDQRLETSSGEGSWQLKDGSLTNLPALDAVAAASGQKSIRQISLSQCSVKFRWQASRLKISSLEVAASGTFSAQGSLTIEKGGGLGGEVQLGVAPALLTWLPRAGEDIFPREDGGLRWTTVHLSGTTAKPENDLIPRIAKALGQDPGAAVELLLRRVGEWLEQKDNRR